MSTVVANIKRLRALKKLRTTLRAERASRRAALRTVTASPNTDPGPKASDYFDDPQGFCETFLAYRHGRELRSFRLWAKQGDLAKAVLAFRRVACRSGHKVGKSALGAALAIWWACTRPSARVILTAPTGRQIKKAIWYEVRRFWHSSPKLRAIMPTPPLQPETGVRWEDGRELFGFSAENADAVSGPGGPEVFIVIDEGSGVSREVWQALQGIRAGGGKVLALGNPTQTVGWFFDAFHEKRAGWSLHVISSTDTPNFIEGREVIPGLAMREHEEEVRLDSGVDSPEYAVRVLGNFPTLVGNAIIGLGLIETARALWDESEPPDGNTVDLGVDVARYGDDHSAVCGRIGLKLFTPLWFEKTHQIRAVVNGYDAIKVANLVVQCLAKLPTEGRRVRIKIDDTGEWAGPLMVELRLRQDKGDLDPNISIVGVEFAGESSNPDKFPVVRDELWFGAARPWFSAGGAIYPDPKLESELMAATYAPDVKGRNKVEPKRDIKKRLGRSPDRADAALLAIYEPGVTSAVVKPADVSNSRWTGSLGRGFG